MNIKSGGWERTLINRCRRGVVREYLSPVLVLGEICHHLVLRGLMCRVFRRE